MDENSKKKDDLSVIDQIRSCGFEPEKVDEGAYGTIFSVRDYQGAMFAIKYIKEPLYQLVGFQGLPEIDILSRVEHPHIIHSGMIITSLSCELRDSLAISMPLADMTLSTAIVNNLFTTEAKLGIIYKLVTALDFLHGHNILHLDIKTTNIVLRDNQPYLIDFGLAMFVEDATKGRNYAHELVTETNRPPEIFAGGRQYNAAVDVWSLGMVILSLLSGKSFLFSDTVSWGMNKLMIIELETIVQSLPKLLVNLSQKYRSQCLSLLQTMLELDPKRRLTTAQVIEHSLFDDVRMLIVGHINQPVYNPVYSSDHRDILKIMLLWAQQVFIDNSAQSLLLAIDIYNRASTFYDSTITTTTQRMALGAMCLVMGMKLLEEVYLNLPQYQIVINKLIPEITTKDLLNAETEILYHLDGVLYRSPFFDKLTTGDELILTFSHIIMDRDSTLYLRVDYDAWVRLVKQLESNKIYPTKDITIKQLLSL